MNIVLKETLGFVDIKIYDNNIFHTNVVGKVPLTVAQAKEITAFRMDNMGGKKALMLYTRDDRYTVPTPEVIEYIKSTDRKENVLGDAFVIKSFSQRLFVKTLSTVRGVQVPTSFFASKQKATDWLLGLK